MHVEDFSKYHISLYSVIIIIIKYQFQPTRDKINNLSCVKGILWISCTAIKHVKVLLRCIVIINIVM